IIETLTNLEENINKFIDKQSNLNQGLILKYVIEINPAKLKEFQENFITLNKNIHNQLFIEQNKKEINHKLLNLKEAIVNPEIYFNLEEDIKYQTNLFNKYINDVLDKINKREQGFIIKQRTPEELQKIIDHKDEKIQELLSQMEKYKWLEAKEQTEKSKISFLEEELLKKTKLAEQSQTLITIHVAYLEKEIDNLMNQVKKLNNDIKMLDNSNLEKEEISLELIKELKDEILTTKHFMKNLKKEEKNE
ncbi:MAG TPA: hypothetical protein P5513_02440, partial [Candidatus Diapherotrites archaeon]|nr:hypothetical protein [Candidatus Diapherotrites archaeon]